MPKFTLFWLTGKSEVLEGKTFEDAMYHAGYGHGAMRALDFFSNGDKRKDWVWNKEKHTWESYEKARNKLVAEAADSDPGELGEI